MKKLSSILIALMASISLVQAAIIELDGKFEDWDALPADKLAKATYGENAIFTNLYEFRLVQEGDAVFFYVEFNDNVFDYYENGRFTGNGYYVENFRMLISADNNPETGWSGDLWTTRGADYEIEGSWYNYSKGKPQSFWTMLYTFAGSKPNEWKWEYTKHDVVISADPVKLPNSHMAIEAKIDLSLFPVKPVNVKIGMCTVNADMKESGVLPQLIKTGDKRIPSAMLSLPRPQSPKIAPSHPVKPRPRTQPAQPEQKK